MLFLELKGDKIAEGDYGVGKLNVIRSALSTSEKGVSLSKRYALRELLNSENTWYQNYPFSYLGRIFSIFYRLFLYRNFQLSNTKTHLVHQFNLRNCSVRRPPSPLSGKSPCWICFPKKKRSFVRDPDSTGQSKHNGSLPSPKYPHLNLLDLPIPLDHPRLFPTPPNHVFAFTESPCPRHAVMAPVNSLFTSIGMSGMMCARMTQGKASLLARTHKTTRSSPHLSSFYHSSSSATSKLFRSPSDTMARFSPQQSRPVHATPFMNHSNTPSYVVLL